MIFTSFGVIPSESWYSTMCSFPSYSNESLRIVNVSFFFATSTFTGNSRRFAVSLFGTNTMVNSLSFSALPTGVLRSCFHSQCPSAASGSSKSPNVSPYVAENLGKVSPSANIATRRTFPVSSSGIATSQPMNMDPFFSGSLT